MSLEDLMREIDKALELSARVEEKLRLTQERENAYDHNRRSSPSSALSVIANAAIA